MKPLWPMRLVTSRSTEGIVDEVAVKGAVATEQEGEVPMRPMKRTLTLLLSAVLVVLRSAMRCRMRGTAGVVVCKSSAARRAQPPAGKTLVVYFSATGNTEAVVQNIVDETGATSFAIQPAQPTQARTSTATIRTAASRRSMRTRPCRTLRLPRTRLTTGLPTIPSSSDIPSGGARRHIPWRASRRPMTSPARPSSGLHVGVIWPRAERRHLSELANVESGWAACAFPRA